MWLVFAFGFAIFAGVTSVLAKCGIRKTGSTAATWLCCCRAAVGLLLVTGGTPAMLS